MYNMPEEVRRHSYPRPDAVGQGTPAHGRRALQRREKPPGGNVADRRLGCRGERAHCNSGACEPDRVERGQPEPHENHDRRSSTEERYGLTCTRVKK